jgi:type II secretory pathway component PulJ
MISLAIFGVIMGVLFGFLVGARNSYSDTREKAQYQQSMRAVMSLITREIRSAGCDPLDDGFNFDKFGVADAGQLQVRMDLNGDMDIVDIGPDENVSYAFAGGNLTRDNGNGPQVILRGIQAFTFTYFDAVLSAANRDLVRFVGINIQGQTDQGEPVTYSTRIALRNG